MKKSLFKRISRYKSFVKGSILEAFAYKWQTYSWFLAEILGIVLLCFLWTAIYRQPNASETINGFTLPQMITYLLTAKIVQQLVGGSQAFWIVVDDIREGNIAMQLIKPISYRYRVFASSLGVYISNLLMAFIPLYLVATIVLSLIFGGLGNIYFSLHWYNWIFFFISSLLSLYILDTFDFIFAQVSFYTGAGFGLMLLKDSVVSFLSGALLPFTFFPMWTQKFLEFLPFASMLATPNMIMMGNFTLLESLMKLGLQVLWALVLGFIAWLTYRASCKHVISVGG